MLILKVRVLSEIIRESGESTGCFVKDLSALDCRAGCPICCLEEKAEKLSDGFPSVLEGPGNKIVIQKTEMKFDFQNHVMLLYRC